MTALNICDKIPENWNSEIKIPFRSSFTEDASRWNSEEYVFPLKDCYKKREFMDDVMCAAFDDFAIAWKEYQVSIINKK